jgi:hypothetical protein
MVKGKTIMKRTIFFFSLVLLLLFPEFSSAAISRKATDSVKIPILQALPSSELQMIAKKAKPPRPPRPRPRVSPSK